MRLGQPTQPQNQPIQLQNQQNQPQNNKINPQTSKINLKKINPKSTQSNLKSAFMIQICSRPLRRIPLRVPRRDQLSVNRLHAESAQKMKMEILKK